MLVIPAKVGIQIKNTGFRVKPGMTNRGNIFMNHCTKKFFIEKKGETLTLIGINCILIPIYRGEER
jgi:hypothetical protein